MNIFVLDTDPWEAAKQQCDKHVVKMVLETAQLLSTAQFFYGMVAPYKPTHENHPCTVWVRQAESNYIWAYHHFRALLQEYTKRYGKEHACERLIPELQMVPDGFPRKELTDFAQCMPEHYRVPGDPVTAYRAYYFGEKRGFAAWRLGNAPDWWLEGIACLEGEPV